MTGVLLDLGIEVSSAPVPIKLWSELGGLICVVAAIDYHLQRSRSDSPYGDDV